MPTRKERLKFILNGFKKAGVEIDVEAVKGKSDKELDKIIKEMWRAVNRNQFEELYEEIDDEN
jgi:hypothetical protein